MLIKQSHRDVPTKAGGTMRVFIIEPHVPEYPSAKFPGCVVFSEALWNGSPETSHLKFEGPEPIPYDTEGVQPTNDFTQ
ncbi:hypothetical protein QFC19_008742 [Naganishia cerealis]|uniref:Uncharacterized protein n=1 Tax=Naganishia cerealis TaxID=610337 RepID=A0ACC2UZP8_9TREE|nr:hypothetical protein QFC19_008742 [Naganishia cerealis]